MSFTEARTREEHLAWCKQRALEYLDKGDVRNAVVSMISDLGKHEETAPANSALAYMGMSYAANYDKQGARRWIEGFR